MYLKATASSYRFNDMAREDVTRTGGWKSVLSSLLQICKSLQICRGVAPVQILLLLLPFVVDAHRFKSSKHRECLLKVWPGCSRKNRPKHSSSVLKCSPVSGISQKCSAGGEQIYLTFSIKAPLGVAMKPGWDQLMCCRAGTPLLWTQVATLLTWMVKH